MPVYWSEITINKNIVNILSFTEFVDDSLTAQNKLIRTNRQLIERIDSIAFFEKAQFCLDKLSIR